MKNLYDWIDSLLTVKYFFQTDLENLKNFLSDKLFIKIEEKISLKDINEIETSLNECLPSEKDHTATPN